MKQTTRVGGFVGHYQHIPSLVFSRYPPRPRIILEHLLRINRLMEMPRGSGLLVGVGGSGKQSLTRLSSFISRAPCRQIVLTKTYNKNSFLEDIRGLYMSAGPQLKPTTFLFTESEIKDEVFLENMNSVLLTGEIPGLFAKV